MIPRRNRPTTDRPEGLSEMIERWAREDRERRDNAPTAAQYVRDGFTGWMGDGRDPAWNNARERVARVQWIGENRATRCRGCVSDWLYRHPDQIVNSDWYWSLPAGPCAGCSPTDAFLAVVEWTDFRDRS